MPFIVRRGSKLHPRLPVDIGGHEVVFEPAVLAGGERVHLAEVSDRHPGLAAIRRKVQGTVGTRMEWYPDRPLLDGDDILPPPRTAPPMAGPPVEVPGDTLRTDDTVGSSWPPAVAAAMRNGWTLEDFDGIRYQTAADDQGPWGEEAGRSRQTGLTVAEMALCVPPDGWRELAATKYPWEVLGWKGPGLGFKPPAAPSKVREEPVPPEVRSAGGESDPVPAAPAPAPASPAEPRVVYDEEEPATEGAPEPRTRRPRKGKASEDVPAGPSPATPIPAAGNPVVLASYGDSSAVAQAVEVLADNWRRAGKAPTLSKANHLLGKAKLPSANETQLTALLASVRL